MSVMAPLPTIANKSYLVPFWIQRHDSDKRVKPADKTLACCICGSLAILYTGYQPPSLSSITRSSTTRGLWSSMRRPTKFPQTALFPRSSAGTLVTEPTGAWLRGIGYISRAAIVRPSGERMLLASGVELGGEWWRGAVDKVGARNIPRMGSAEA